MNGKNTEYVIDGQEGVQQETVEYKTFKQDCLKIDYSNTSKIMYQEPK